MYKSLHNTVLCTFYANSFCSLYEYIRTLKNVCFVKKNFPRSGLGPSLESALSLSNQRVGTFT